VIHTIVLGDSVQPRALDVNPSNGHIYVANVGADTISEIDGQTNNLLNTIPVGSISESHGPVAVAFNTLNSKIYVANSHSDDVAVIDTSLSKVIESIPVGSDPEAIVFDSNNGDIYTANSRSNTVSVISTISEPPPPHTMPPTHTTITSAIDGNGNSVQDGGLTVSTSITFHVTATPGTNPIAGFECSLDASSFSTCASDTPPTIKFNNLEARQKHTFEVRAVDTQGNKDPSPATLTWTILTPKQAIQKLINTIENMHLGKSTKISLEIPLIMTTRLLNGNIDKAACNTLSAFKHQVNANEASGRLTSQQSADLRQQATAIQAALGCHSASSSSSSLSLSRSTPPSVQPQQHQRQSPYTDLMTTNNEPDGQPSTLSLWP
jgi:YVTN family beta-propeller protein